MENRINVSPIALNSIAAAPQWILTAMQQTSSEIKKLKKATVSALQSEQEGNIIQLEKQCPRFQENWATQQQEGLDEDTWFLVVSHLLSIFDIETALYFSQASHKHDQRSEDRIMMLQDQEKNLPIRCTTFGCVENDIKTCFNERIRRNKKLEIINSPGASFRKSKQLSSIGFILDKETGKFKGINENKFARYLVKHRLHIVYSNHRFYLYENNVWKVRETTIISRQIREILHEFIPDIWSQGIEKQYLAGLEMEARYVEKMGTDRSKINLINGMIDLNTLKLIPHDRACYSTIQIPITFDPAADCPKFITFLNQIFEQDQQLINIVGEMLGYCLTAEVKAQKAFILYGKGSNGKSVLAEILKSLCGLENVSALSLSDLEKPFARYELVDKLLNLATENEVSSAGLDTTNFKGIVSGDPIRVEKKHETGFLYNPVCKVVLGLNNLPHTKDKSYGFTRRLLMIPFFRQFSGKEANVNLLDELLEELPGILNFALEGLKRLRNNHYSFTHSDRSVEVLRAYQEELNPVEMFIDDMIEPGQSTERVLNKDIRYAFDNWCQDNGHRILQQYSQIKLNNNIRDVFQQKGGKAEPYKANGERGLQGIKLKKKSRHASLLRHSAEKNEVNIEDMT